jgi:hypothetical protein
MLAAVHLLDIADADGCEFAECGLKAIVFHDASPTT